MAPPITLSSPFPAADLRLASLRLSAGLSRMEAMQLDLLSPMPDLEPEKILGRRVGIAVALADDSTRHLGGHVTAFGLGVHEGGMYRYEAEVRPWLWALTRTADCRIFQDLSVPDIVRKVFDDHAGIAAFDFKLQRSYRKRVYCVQYRETDFDFVARLLEDEGITWYFEHTDAEDRMVLVDAADAHAMAPGCDALPYYDNIGQTPPDKPYVFDLRFARSVRTGRVALTSYDFERPSTALGVTQQLQRAHELADAECFDFQGDYVVKDDGQQQADTRIDEWQSLHERMHGSTTVQTMAVGSRLAVSGHPRADRNADGEGGGDFLCVEMELRARNPGVESGRDPGSWDCSFVAQPGAQQFRPLRRTPRPIMRGPQTAVVVGPAGEEIHTDKYGRVKVQFHWDRYGGKDEKSSCWVRVSSPWAGKRFGFVQIPRIGQEVVVDFLEGDPDQPLITGRVYNAEQMPPWDLPANATQSGVLTRSSKGGAYGNANAIRFEDKTGSEQLWIHAEKNQDIEVENDETHWVGHDRTKTIDHDETSHIKHDRTETVDNNETITIGVDRTESVGNHESITIGVNRTEQVGANETIAIGANRTETVGANESITIGANRTISVGSSETATVALQRTHTVGVNETIAIGAAQEIAIGAAQVVAVGATQSISVGASQSTEVGANRSVQVGGDQSTTVGKGRSTQVGKDDALKVGKNLVIDAGDSVTIKTGSASITMKKDGTIVIKGKDITVNGSGKINMKASSDVVIKGSKVGIN